MKKIKFRTFDGVRLTAAEFRPRRAPSAGAPAVLIIEGSGKSSSGGDLPTSPFYQLGRILAAEGCYVLTYNKRGSGLNTNNGSFYRSTFWTDNKDAQAALNFLRSSGQADKDKIFLMGQSMGGVHVTALALKNKIAGCIYFASAFKDFRETLRQQNAEILGLMGRSASEIGLELKKMAKMLKAIETGTFRREDYAAVCRKMDGANIIDGVQEKYFRDVLKIDNARETARLTIPLLIMQGTSDFVINLDDLEAVRAALKRSGRENARLRILPKVDHIFSDRASKASSLKYMRRVKQTGKFGLVSKKILREIIEFLNIACGNA